MLVRFCWLTLTLWLAGAWSPRSAMAQTLDQLGNRAAALGAFVAVADDASAVAWNPAGLVNGPIFNILLDFGRVTEPGGDLLTSTRQAGRSGGTFLAAGVPPLGLSYYRMRKTELNPAVESGSGRQNEQLGVRSLVTSQLGVTLLQSLADGLTVGATVKLVHGRLASDVVSATSWDAAFDAAEELEASGQTTVDLDAGALLATGRLRVGLVARNLAAPSFDDRRRNGMPMTLDRHVRAGVAWGDAWPGISTLIVALDADLTRVRQVSGDRRDLAAGAERWFGGQKFAVRGGVRASMVDGARPMASGGGSLAVRAGTYVDVYAARGRNKDGAWGIAARLMY